MLTTTFRQLRKRRACSDRYKHLAKCLGGVQKYGENTPIPLIDILDHNGLYDTLWAFCAVGKNQESEMLRVARLFACWCVRHTPLADGRTTWDLLTDERSRNAVDVAEQYAIGNATDEGLNAARNAAWSATRSAAWSAARNAAWSAALSVATNAARSAAWSATRSATRSVARSVARNAARNAAMNAQSSGLRSLLLSDKAAMEE